MDDDGVGDVMLMIKLEVVDNDHDDGVDVAVGGNDNLMLLMVTNE